MVVGVKPEQKEAICLFKHDDKSGLVAVPGHLGDDIAIGTLNSILKQAGLKE